MVAVVGGGGGVEEVEGGAACCQGGGGRAVFKMNAICLCDSTDDLSSAAFDLLS